jgi:hypothetical protein
MQKIWKFNSHPERLKERKVKEKDTKEETRNKERKSREKIWDYSQAALLLNSQEKDIRSVVINMFGELKETISKELRM